MRLYKLYLAKPLLIFYLIMFAMWTIAPIVLIILTAMGKLGLEGPPVWLFVIMLCFTSFAAYSWLRFPFEIRIRDDRKIEFRSIFRTVVISPAEIKSVRAKRYALGFIDIVHQKGTVHLLNQMDGFHEFIATIKSMNPAVEIKGC